ncbi:hypothetical protein DL764_006480 [Monosporascus ibericus]|uniref:Reverse transcriptase domain-containing protein n=1 Tax=Monosporascus ibericus TaxID=155417 RepID=A0A4V1XA27_9PEZI|nr:hypothetical protein DL764_006480 [Monosporascus ibericus]
MASSGGSVLFSTIQDITDTKLEELSKRRSRFEAQKAQLISSSDHEKQPLKRLQILSRGVKACYAVKTDNSGKVLLGQTKNRDLERELQNLDCFLAQATYDPSVSGGMMGTWEKSLLRHLDMQSLKFQYASLYAQLVTEWLAAEKSDQNAPEPRGLSEGSEDGASAMKRDSRAEWERMVFEPANVDEDVLRAYLNMAFGLQDPECREKKNALRNLRVRVAAFESKLSAPNQFDNATLQWVADGLVSSTLLTDEKREVLKDFKNNPIILSEIADVLNMRIAALDSWTWGDGCGVPLEQQRRLSGIYNIVMQEDLLQALFLEYVGVKWSVFLKSALREFCDASGSCKARGSDVPKADLMRRQYYLGEQSTERSVQWLRNTIYQKHYFLSHLKDSETQRNEASSGEEEAEYQAAPAPTAMQYHVQQQGQQMAQVQHQQAQAAYSRQVQMPRDFQQMRGRSIQNDFGMDAAYPIKNRHKGDSEEDEDDGLDAPPGPSTRKFPMEDKQRLLRLLATEAAISTKLYGGITAFHSVFDSWNSLLPHETVLAVLDFFGVSKPWLGFFARFLRAPLRFVEDDDDGQQQPRTRCRGTPASHVLSDFFGEAVLFCLDLAVNRATDGGDVLWRAHDDFWFWSRDHGAAVKAWGAVSEFAAVTGTRANATKSGSVRIPPKDQPEPMVCDNEDDVGRALRPALPEGDVRWGFLRLSPRTGRFEIDQDMVDRHIADLRGQLRDKRRRGVIAFVQAWNTYAATFFTANFGKPAHCFGREHVCQMLETHHRIQRELFSPPSSSSSSPPSLLDSGSTVEGSSTVVNNIVDYLKVTLEQRFGIQDVPDAYLFFPMELGGLDLRSPFVSILQAHDGGRPGDPEAAVERFLEAECDAYARLKAIFKDRGPVLYRTDDACWKPSADDRRTFMSFQEYARHREAFYHGFEGNLYGVYRSLLRAPRGRGIRECPPAVARGVEDLQLRRPGFSGGGLGGFNPRWEAMEPYWKWVAALYGPEAMERFGGLHIVEPGLLPMGMVSLFRDRRVKWQG